ncbi:phage tail protein [Chloroflexi bacterium TSY]|nr:phage tail protein [Chloroflexi bacterium TSY]
MRLQEITATPHPSGNRIDLSWVNPDPDQYPGVRVVRREGTHPTAPDDGVVVTEGVELTSAVDENLQSETVYYYGLFPYTAKQSNNEQSDYQFDRHNRTAAMATAPYDMAGRMMDLLPGIYHRYDTILPDPETPRLSEADQPRGQLRRFLDLPGGQLDQLYSLARAMLNLYDIDQVDGRLLPLLAEWIGWQTNYRLDIDAQRNELRSAPSVYQRIGIIPTTEATVKRILGWESRVKEFVHNVFLSNHPEQLNIWLRTRPSSGQWSTPTGPLSLDFAYEGRPTAVLDAGGTLWLFYHTRRNERWDIWYKSLLTFTLDAALQADLARGVLSIALQQAFAEHGFSLSLETKIAAKSGDEWLLTDAENQESYTIRVDADQLTVYRWAPSQRLTNRMQIDKHPTAVMQGDILWVFWDSYDPTGRTWQINYRTYRGSEWSAIETFGDEDTARRTPAAAVDHSRSLWLFWLEKSGDEWGLKYARRTGDEWGFVDNDQAPRVESDLFVLFQPANATPDATPRLWVFWAHKVSTGEPNQTRWQIAYRVATNIDASDLTPDWGRIHMLQKESPHYDDREPAAFVNADGDLELFWSSNQDGSWSIWHSTLRDIEHNTWNDAEQITANPYSQRAPFPVSIGTSTWLLYRSNESVTYASAVYGATQTMDFRYAGATTVDTRNVAKIALRSQYEDCQAYTYDVGQDGVRTDLDWYARDTVGMYLNAETEDQQIIRRNRNLIEKVLQQFLPIQIRVVFIIEPAA